MKIPFWNKIWKESSGFTMAELVAGLAIMAIVIVFAGSLLIFTQNVFAGKSQQSVRLRQLELAGEFIQEQLKYAKAVTVSYEPLEDQGFLHTIQFGADGTISIDGNPILKATGKTSYGVCIKKNTGNHLENILEYSQHIFNEKNETLSSDDNVVELVNLPLSGSQSVVYPQLAGGLPECFDSYNRDLYICYRE